MLCYVVAEVPMAGENKKGAASVATRGGKNTRTRR